MQQWILNVPQRSKNKIFFTYIIIHSYILHFTYLKKKTKPFPPYFPSIIERDNLNLQTRAQGKKAMKKFEQNQATLREDMDSIKGNMEETKDKIDQLMRAITNMMAREAEAERRKVTFVSIPAPVDGNPLQGFTSDIQGGEAKNGTLHPEGSIPTIVHNGAFRLIQISVPHDNYVDLSQQYEDEDHRGMVQESKPAAHPASTIGETSTKDK